MKNSSNKISEKPASTTNHKSRPENKDDMDSREGEEQLTKGDDVTHNKKEDKSKKTGRK